MAVLNGRFEFMISKFVQIHREQKKKLKTCRILWIA